MGWEELEGADVYGPAKPVNDVKEPGAMQQIDSDADRAQVQQMQIDLDGKPTGWAAAGYTAKMAERIDKGNEEIRERYYKNNPTGYRNYLDYAKRQQAATLATAADYEAANLRHARQEDEKLQAEHEANVLAGFNGTFLATHKLNEADAISSAQDVLAAESFQNAATMDEFNGPDGVAAGDRELGADVVATHEAASEVSVNKYRAAVKAAASGFDGKIDQLWAHNDKELHAIYNRTRERALAAGASPFTADAIAQKTVNGVANKIMIDMFSGSEIGSGNRQAFEKWMARLKAGQVVKTDENGTTYDPMRRWCMTRSDIKALDEKYRQVVRYEQSVMKAQDKAQRLAEKEAQKRIDAENVNAIESVVFAAKNMRNRLLYGDMKNQDPHAVASKFIDKIANMLPGQYMKEKENAVTEINTVFDQVFNLREQVVKLDARQASERLLGLYDRVRSDQINRIAKNVQGDYYGQYFLKGEDGKYTGESVETLNRGEGANIGADVQAICIATRLREMDIPANLKASLDADIKHLSEERQAKDRDVCVSILNSLRFQRPKEGQRERISFSALEAVMIDGVASGQSGTDIILDGSGRRINMSAAKGDVVTIEANGVKYSLGKAEMEDIVRNVYDIVSDIKEDISGTDDTAVKRRNEIAEKIRGYMLNKAIGKDAEHGYSALATGLRTARSQMMASGVTGRANYMYRAAFREENGPRYESARERSGRIKKASENKK